MKITKTKLKEIIREELQKVIAEARKLNGYYLMDALEDLAGETKRAGEPKAAKALMYLHSRINQSYRDKDLSVDDVLDLFNDPRGRKYGREVPDWMIEDLFEGKKRAPVLNEKKLDLRKIYDLEREFNGPGEWKLTYGSYTEKTGKFRDLTDKELEWLEDKYSSTLDVIFYNGQESRPWPNG